MLAALMSRADLVRRVQEYADRKGLLVGRELGFGVHGIVFSAERQTEGGPCALKVHERAAAYAQERDVYLRLQEHDVTLLRGCNVPELLTFDDELWVIEMTVVTRPFVLDFAGASLDQPPGFSEEVLADWQREKQEQFGPHWAEVQAILRALEGYGVFMLDVNPGNVAFGD
jgi:hypothetical protein